MFKKVLALVLVLLMTFALAACGGDANDVSSDSATTSEVVADVDETESKQDASEDKKTESEKGKETGSQKASSTGKTNTSSRDLTTGNGGGATVDKTTNKNITPAVGNIKVKEGKSLTEGLNLKGKTITMAITPEEGQYNSASFKRIIAAFEKEYNCKVKTKALAFAKYNQLISNALAAGDSYDIAYIHGSMYPSCAIDGLYEDLTDKIRTADLMDNDHPEKGGIDLNKTSYFASFENRIYGTCNFQSVFPYAFYYNKVKFQEAGLKDPRLLEKAGKWNWNIIQQYGRKVTSVDDNVYFLSNAITGRGVPLCFDAPLVRVTPKKNSTTNSVYIQNLTSTNYIEAYKFMAKLIAGVNPISEPLDSAHAWNSSQTFMKGNTYMWLEETSKYLDISKTVLNSAAFGKKKENIGIVTMPLGSTNKKGKYPTGWLTAVACGKGKDPRVSIAWDVFRSTYKDPIVDANAMSKSDTAYMLETLKGDIACEVGMFGTSGGQDIDAYESQIRREVAKGGDVSSLTQSYKDLINAAIKFTMKK